jgi:DNA-binding IclR family transcriptional regulator
MGNGFLQRRWLRDDTLLQATVLATLHHLGGFDTGVTCDELADQVGVGRGRVIHACDGLARQGLVEKDRGVVTLAAGAHAYLAIAENAETEAA